MENNLNLLALLQKKLFENDLDVILTISNKITLELEDLSTKTTVAVVKGNSLEDAYANLLGTLANNARALKTYDGLSKL
jgi:ribosomal protein L12E/L44/L45/RPP1/RPP2